jgi:hypothetical protein
VKPEKKKKNQMYNTKENLEIEPRVWSPTSEMKFVCPTAITSYSVPSHLLPFGFCHRHNNACSWVFLLVEGNGTLCVQLNNWGNGSEWL